MNAVFCFEDKGIYGTVYYESQAHLDCKRILVNWLHMQRIDALCECRIPTINRRADIYFHYGNKSYAFEVQLSPISSDDYLKRTRDYEEAGIIPYWIGSGKLNDRPHSVPFCNLDECYIRHTPLPHALYIDRSKERLFIRHSFSYEKHKRIRVMDTHKAKRLFMSDLENPSRAVGNAVFFDKREKQNWLRTTRYKRAKTYLTLTPGERVTLKLLQSYGLNLNYFPAICRIPLRNQFILRTHPEIWQTWFLLKLIVHADRYRELLYLSELTERMGEAVRFGVIQFRDNCMLHKNGLRALVEEYLGWLIWIGVLSDMGEGVYLIQHEVSVKKTLDTLITDDRFVMDEAINYLVYRKE